MKRWQRWARSAPLPVKRGLKLAARPLDVVWRWRWRRRNPGSVPIPPLALRSRVGVGSRVAYYVNSGRAVADGIDQAADRAGAPLNGVETVLDLGCGCGRVLGHLVARHPGVRFLGCDVDAEAIAWARRNLDRVELAASSFEPPLPYRAGSVDVLYSISIFTHLRPADQARWAQELQRVLRPGGVALITFCGPTMLRMIRDSRVVSNSADFTRRARALGSIEERSEPVFVPYVRGRSNRADFPGIDGEYGLSFQTAEHTSRLWGPHLGLIELREGAINEGQDLALMRPAQPSARARPRPA